MRMFVLVLAVMLACSVPSNEAGEDTDTIAVESVRIENANADSNEGISDVNHLHTSYSVKELEAEQLPTDTASILEFSEVCAIEVYPDTVSLHEQQKEAGEAWDTIIDDIIWYQAGAKDSLQSIGVKVIHPGFLAKRYYKFKFANNIDFYADMYKVRGNWGFILFNGEDIPLICTSAFDVPDTMYYVYGKPKPSSRNN